MKPFICPECDGRGQYVAEYIDYWAREEWCGWCRGTGKMGPITRLLYWWYEGGGHHARTALLKLFGRNEY